MLRDQAGLDAALERLVDEHGLDHVLDSLATLCVMKAAHLREAWQDAGTARVWDTASRKIDRVRVWTNHYGW